MTISSNQLSDKGADLRIRFHDCEAGWIHMDVCHRDSAMTINLSHIYEPLPSMFAWLESVVIGVDESSFEIDEEGSTVKFISTLRHDGIVRLQVVPSYDGEALEMTIPSHQLVSAFYRAFVEFSESPEYKPAEWEVHTLADALRERGEMSSPEWIESVIDLDRRGLQKAIWLLDQTRFVNDELARSCQIYASAEEVLELTGQPPVDDALLVFWPLEGWDGAASQSERMKMLEECLLAKSQRSWDGCPWAKMRSSLIEDCLASKEEERSRSWHKWLIQN